MGLRVLSAKLPLNNWQRPQARHILPGIMSAAAAALSSPIRVRNLGMPTATRGVLEFRRGQTIYYQGDSATSMFWIVQGRVCLNVVSDQGKEAVVGIFQPGDYFGESCLVEREVRNTSAVALEHTTVQRFDRQDLRCTLRSSPEFCEEFMTELLRRQTKIQDEIAHQLFHSSEQRLARVLMALAGDASGTASKVLPRISQTTLATMVGTTRSRVCYFLCKFREMGIIEGKSQMRVSIPRLERMLAEAK